MGKSILQGGKKAAYEKQINYWIFDTDFFILTLYDHLGSIRQSEEYVNKCRSRIGIIDHSWEHLDYYYKYCIRELNIKLNCFDFEGVIARSEPLLKLLTATQKLFVQISKLEGEKERVRSGRLGSLYGVQLQAYTNMIRRNPELYPKALALSDLAIEEFKDNQSSLERHYLYRCQLLVETDKMQEALECFLKSVEIDESQTNVFSLVINEVYKQKDKPKVYVLYHYTNLARHFMEKDDPIGKAMYASLISRDELTESIESDQTKEHPWNLILWNISICHRIAGNLRAAGNMYEKAIAISTKRPEDLTMYSHAFSMAAERMLYYRNRNISIFEETRNQYKQMELIYHAGNPPETMKEAFPQIGNCQDIEIIERIAEGYLK